MAIHNFSALANGVELDFNPASDILHFDDAAISAALLTFDGTDFPDPYVSFTYAGKMVTLNIEPFNLTTTNITFASGSLFILGDNTTANTADQGPNIIVGGAGDDYIHGAEGNDSFSGGAGNDLFLLAGNNPNWGNESIDGGEGIDRILYYTDDTGDAYAITVNLATGVGTGGDGNPGSTLSLTSIEEVFSGDGSDVITGSSGDNFLHGAAGADSVIGGAGADSIIGGAGMDYLRGNAGADTVRGGADPDDIRGGQDGDELYGGSSSDFLAGALGNDVLRGALGEDTVGGGQGDDTIGGGQGHDQLRGGQGHDELTGGLGSDVHVFSNAGDADSDTVLGFSSTEGDRIALDSAFFTSLAPGALTAGEFGTEVLYSAGVLSYDADGAGGAAAVVIATLEGAPTLTADDIFAF